jgi:hypothetical protein
MTIVDKEEISTSNYNGISLSVGVLARPQSYEWKSGRSATLYYDGAGEPFLFENADK